MNRSIDVRNEMRRLAGSKPVHAAAGAGVLASEALRELPARLVRLREDTSVSSLSVRAGELSVRANDYLRSARARAAHQYDSLAARGKLVLNGHASAPATGALNKGKTK